MNNIINKIINDPFDITYFGIGSANVRNSNYEGDRQQIPPFLDEIYCKTKKKIRLINIDIKFEKPYFLTEYLVNTDKNRLEYYYLEQEFLFDNQDTFEIFDFINKTIMDQNNMLFLCDFTGRGLSLFETYFYDLYEKTEYKNKFNKLICYDFNYFDDNTCCLDVTKNYPIIKNNEIIKINYKNKTDFIELIKNNIEHKILIKKTFIKNLKEFINVNLFVYRNIINNNFTTIVNDAIKKSIFQNTNMTNNDQVKFLIKKTVIDEYNEILLLLYDDNIINVFNDLVIMFDNKDPYYICNQFNKFIITLNEN